MKVLQVNIFGNLSTGRIAVDLYRTLRENGHEGIVAYARNTIAEDIPAIKIGNKASIYADGIMTRITDKAGFYSKASTKKLIHSIINYNPDIIHLHNIHGYYVNIKILFNYLKSCGKPVVWTLHDCWAYTGHCCYYSMANCNLWKTGCHNCPQKKAYPRSLLVDNSQWNYNIKKELFTNVPNMHLVTVSKWLANEVGKSYLKNLPCSTIYNGIDIEVFKPQKSNFKKRYGLKDKFIILGVASTWDQRKGLEDFIALSELLDENYIIVIVGVNKHENKMLKRNMIGISRTNSTKELAEIYTAADVFFNASTEETFGLPTVEAIACGTPAIVYKSTALPEVINKQTGLIAEPRNVNQVAALITEIRSGLHKFSFNSSEYDKKINYAKYLDLYKEILDTTREY